MIALGLCGCERDDRVCLRSHEDMMMVPSMMGDTTYLTPMWSTVCDEYAPKPKREAR